MCHPNRHQLHPTCRNHETMNVAGRFRYSTPQGMQDFAVWNFLERMGASMKACPPSSLSENNLLLFLYLANRKFGTSLWGLQYSHFPSETPRKNMLHSSMCTPRTTFPKCLILDPPPLLLHCPCNSGPKLGVDTPQRHCSNPPAYAPPQRLQSYALAALSNAHHLLCQAPPPPDLG